MKLKRISEIKLDLNDRLNLVMNWSKIVGNRIGTKSSPKSFKNGILTILTTSPGWSHHINALRHDIMNKVKDFYRTDVKKVVLLNSTSSKKSIKIIPFYNEITQNFNILKDSSKDIFEGVKDKNIREKLINLSKVSVSRLNYFKNDI
jgi:hypothetical protein